MNIAANAAVTGRRKRKHSLLPLLVVLFLISYGLLTNLVLQQDKTIDSQRTLVHLLLKDSLQLSAMRKAERQKGQADPDRRASVNSLQAQAHAPKIPVIQVPSQSQNTYPPLGERRPFSRERFIWQRQFSRQWQWRVGVRASVCPIAYPAKLHPWSYGGR